MAKHTKRRALRAPFIVTVTAATSAVAFAVMPGCGSTVVVDESEGSSGNPSGCPAEVPPYQGACAQPGLECTYPNDYCPPTTVACEGGVWQTLDSATCNPPPPECPPEIPAQGSPCPVIGESCFYPTNDPCSTIEDSAYCGEDGTWSLSFSTCNPPPPEVFCSALTTEADCASNGPACRWLVPGCADATVPPPALAEAGCFPSYDCAADFECAAGTTCQARVYNPCYNLDCDACGAEAMLCVAP